MVLQMTAAAVVTTISVSDSVTRKLEMLQQQDAATDYDSQRSAVEL
jgi:hypothetical protein